MKKALVIFIALSGLVLMISCAHSHPHHIPPGQAKKMTGSKSAKPYAPGQKKK